RRLKEQRKSIDAKSVGERRIRIARAAFGKQYDEWDVRPGRLATQCLSELLCIIVEQSFFGYDESAHCLSLQLLQHFWKEHGLREDPRARESIRYSGGIPPTARDDKDPLGIRRFQQLVILTVRVAHDDCP